jgi:membrane associated rhomboid family serine protease
VFSFLFVIALFAALAYHIVTPEERRLILQRIDPAAAVIIAWLKETAALREWLRGRTPWLVVTPVLALVNVVVYAGTVFSVAPAEETLLEWGGIHAAAMVAGEWWRLITASTVNGGSFQLFVVLLGIWQPGSLLERLVGPLTVACVYVAAGAMGHVVAMALDVTAVHSGAVTPVFGLYGLLLSASAWRRLRRAEPAMPAAMFFLLAPGAVLLLLTSVVADGLVSERNLAALTVGLVIGFAGTMRAPDTRRPLGPVAMATAAVLAMVAFIAVPIYGSIGLRSQLSAIVALEDRTVDSYRQALKRFTDKRQPVDPKILASVIEDAILPSLVEAAGSMAAAEAVESEYSPLVTRANEYLRLRQEGWTMRAAALRKGSVPQLQKADSRDQVALQALEPLRQEFSAKGDANRVK